MSTCTSAFYWICCNAANELSKDNAARKVPPAPGTKQGVEAQVLLKGKGGKVDPKTGVSTTSGPMPLTGSAAILAKLRAQREESQRRADAAKAAEQKEKERLAKGLPPGGGTDVKVEEKKKDQAAALPVTICYASQMGTGQEIARGIHAECVQRGLQAKVMSFNELGYRNLGPETTPILVVVASSTGDGDPPDNAAEVWVQLRKKHHRGKYKGMHFTILGLGDSNYTRFMHVPRGFKSRFLELGAEIFYPCVEADEVDGLEATVDPWVDQLWGPLMKLARPGGKATNVPGEAKATTATATTTTTAATPPTAAASTPLQPPTPPTQPAVTPSSPDLPVASPAMTTPGVLNQAQGSGTARGVVSASPIAVTANGVKAAIPSDPQVGVAPPALSPKTSVVGTPTEFASADNPKLVEDSKPSSGQDDEQQTSSSRPPPPAPSSHIVSESDKKEPMGKLSMDGVSPGSPSGTPLASRQNPSGSAQEIINGEAPGSANGSAFSAEAKTSPLRFLTDLPRISPETSDPGPSATTEATYGSVPPTPKQHSSAGAGLEDGFAPEGVDLTGVPALPPCRVRLIWTGNSMSASEEERPTVEQLFYRDPEGTYSAQKPFWARVTEARYMTAPWSTRRVIHMEVDIKDSGIQYQAGDAIGVLPENSPEVVEKLLKRLGVDGNRVFKVEGLGDGGSTSLLAHIPWPCSARVALTYGCDVTSVPRKSLLRTMAEYCTDERDKRTLLYFTSRAGRDAYSREMLEEPPSLLDLLTRFPSCMPPLDVLMDVLPPLQPRMYSITTSPLESPQKVQVCFTVVKEATRYGTKYGVATNWLEKICKPLLAGSNGLSREGEPDKGGAPVQEVVIPIFLRSGGSFSPPSDLSKPQILVGPGTGVAPFRGFLQHRRHQLEEANGSVDNVYLYFGCRREDEDYLYRSDLETFKADGTLHRLRVAFSRAQENKVYVQHLMEKDGKRLADLLTRKGGYVFVCGDGAQMAKDVHACLTNILVTHSQMSEVDATAYLTNLVKQGRYVRDIWV